MTTRILPALLALLAFGCTGETTTAPENQTGGDASAPKVTTKVIETAEVHDAICGHVLEDVGKCGNYVKIDGQYVVLEWPELGVMDYCKDGEKGAKVEITGEMKDGKFVAKTYRRVE